MPYMLKRTVEPLLEPITLDQAKSQCRIEGYDDDGLLEIYIKAAREHCEKLTGRAILQQTWLLTRDAFPYFQGGTALGRSAQLRGWPGYGYPSQTAPLLLPRPNLLNIVSVQYFDFSGVLQTLGPGVYTTSNGDGVASLAPTFGTWWPAAALRPDAVQVTYTAGYGATVAAVPAAIQLACLLLVGHWYENREATQAALQGNGPMPLPLGVDDLLSGETIVAFTYES